MYQLNGLSLTDCAVWRSAQFTFEEGVTDVRGGNRMGKSLLFSPLPACLFGTPLPKRGFATLHFSADERSVDITAKSQGKNNLYDIAINGRDQKTDTIAKGRAVIDRLLPIPESLFYTTVHVSGLNKHPLAEAKPSARLEWVQQVLADSQIYDSYAEVVARELSTLKSDVGKAELLKQQIANLKPPEPLLDSLFNGHEDSLREERKALTPKIDALNQFVEELRVRVSVGELVEFDADEYARLKKLNKTLNAKRDAFQVYQATQGQRDMLDNLAAKIKKLAAEIGAPDLPPKKLLKGVQKKIAKYESKLSALQEQMQAWKAQAQVREDLELSVRMEFTSVKQLDQREEELKDKRQEVKRHLRLAESGKSECPTCGSSIKLGKHSEKDLDKIEAHLETISLQKRKLAAQQVELVEKPNLNAVEAQINFLRSLETLCEKYIERQVDDVEEVEYDADKHKKVKRRLERMEEHRTQHEMQERMLANVSDKIRRAPLHKAEKVLAQEQDKLRNLNSRLLEISDKLTHLDTYNRLLQQYEKQKREFEKALAELGDVEQKHRVLKALRAAFSRDGLLALRLDRLATTFVDQLNACAPLIWNEPFKFELDIGPRRCDVIAHRNRQASTISSFSGSEQRGWQLVSALALLRILPSNKRFDTIILDELEANMDVHSKRRFTQDYIPELLKVVPKVVIVTPLDRKELDIASDRSYQVVKKRAVSTLEKI